MRRDQVLGPVGAGLLVSVLVGVWAGCSPKPTPTAAVAPPAADPDLDRPAFFQDVTAATGIRHTYQNGEDPGEYPKHLAIIESIGGGVALFDSTGTACSTSSSPAAATSQDQTGRRSSASRASSTAISAAGSSRM